MRAVFDQQAGMTLITASAGAGKTHLLSQWSRLISAIDDTDVVSISLGCGLEFLASIRVALELIDDDRLTASLSSVPPGWGVSSARALARVMDATDRRIVIILGDFHLLETRESADVLTAFIDALPRRVNVVLAGRGSRVIPLARRRITGVALELGDRDLAFTAGEARALFGSRGDHLSEKQIDRILQRTRGWAAGLVLMMHIAADSHRKLGVHLRGDEPVVVNYLLEEVVGGLDDELLEFLLATSIPETFTLDLAALLFSEAPTLESVQALIRLNILTEADAYDPIRYQLHPVLRDFLLTRLKDRDPGRVRSLERVAAEWFAEEQDYVPAIRHAVATGDPDFVWGILSRCGVQLILMGHTDDVSRVLGQLPRSSRKDAAVQMLIATADVMRGHAGAAAVALTTPDDVASVITNQWRTGLGLHVANQRGGIDEVLSRTTVESMGQSQLDIYVSLQAARGELHLGHLDRADRYALRVLDRARIERASVAELQATIVRNASALFRGRVRAAAAGGERFERRWQDLDEPRGAFTALNLAWWYWARYELMQERPGQLRRLVHAAAEISSAPTIVRGIRGLVALTRVGDSEGTDSHDAAVSLLELLSPREDMPVPVHWHAMIAPFVVRALGRLGEPHLRDEFIGATDRVLDGTSEMHLLRATAAMQDQRHGEASDVLALAFEGAGPWLLHASSIDAWLVAADLHVQQGQLEQAQIALDTALRIAEPEGLVRRFADAGPAIAQLLASRSVVDAPSAFASRVQGRLLSAIGQEDHLTPRERVVLAALSRNATLREIARQEFVSHNTVKTHTRNIYRKLGVSDRRSAAAAARDLGLSYGQLSLGL